MVMKFIGEKADIAANSKLLLKVVEEAKMKFSGVEAWGAFGLCWGGKVGFPSLLILQITKFLRSLGMED